MKSKFTIIFLAILLFPTFSFAQISFANAREKYQAGQKVKILIIPGHDKKYSGAYFRGISEQEINLELANKIKTELAKDPLVEVVVSRDADGYIKDLQKYFEERKSAIKNFIEVHKKQTAKQKTQDGFELDAQVPHADALPEVAYQLYGTNKWAAENDFDLIVNVHFNDDTNHAPTEEGDFSGFTIYVPDEKLLNHEEADILGAAIGFRMSQTFPLSNMPLEANIADDGGVVSDFNLIALGSNRTLKIPSVLVEYSYIYEPHIKENLFDLSSYVMARATTRGIYDYLNGSQAMKNLLYFWDAKSLGKDVKQGSDVLALQFALSELGFFPAKNFQRCNFDAVLGPCTQASIKEFQKANNLIADGVPGLKTKSILNTIFSTGL
jgi:N-acetylmuramoyl-L-alanine amidase